MFLLRAAESGNRAATPPDPRVEVVAWLLATVPGLTTAAALLAAGDSRRGGGR